VSNGLKEKLVLAGGSLSVAALVCGIGLLLKSPTSSAVPAQEPETNSSADTGAASGHGEATAKGDQDKAAPARGAGKSHDESRPAHGEDTGDGAKAAHGAEAEPGGSGQSTPESKFASASDASVEPEIWRGRGDAAVACGRYDDAIRYYGMALKKISPEQKAECELRLADATWRSPSLPAQLRAQKALEGYSRILAEAPKSREAVEAQFQVGNCLTVQNRWQEALEAFDRYEKAYPLGVHRDEVRYRRAEVLSVLGSPDQASEILEELVKGERNTERKSKAILLLARVKLQMVRTDPLAPAQGLPESHREEIESRVPGPNETSEAGSGDRKALPMVARQAIAVPSPRGVSETQWAGIIRSVESGNLSQAQRVVQPYMEQKDHPEQNALVMAHWARLLKAVAEHGALDLPMDGIMISSRAE
jgi:hypothetical protein